MSSRMILRRVEELETIFALSEPQDDWINVLMWSGRDGGAFGHMRFRFSRSRGEQHWSPCSDAEEVAIMRRHYEDEGRRPYGRGAKVGFAEYLERFSYLGPEELAARRRMIIEGVKNDGA